MVDEKFKPSENQEKILRALKEENRANPQLIKEKTGIEEQKIKEGLTALRVAGWIRKVTEGLYDFTEDPR